MNRAQQRFSPGDAASVIAAVGAARGLILEDATPVNYCGVPELFDEAGRLMFDQSQHSARFRSMTECSARTEGLAHLDARRVEVASIRNFGDSLQVIGVTRKGNTHIHEMYLLVRLRNNIVFREYRVFAIAKY